MVPRRGVKLISSYKGLRCLTLPKRPRIFLGILGGNPSPARLVPCDGRPIIVVAVDDIRPGCSPAGCLCSSVGSKPPHARPKIHPGRKNYKLRLKWSGRGAWRCAGRIASLSFCTCRAEAPLGCRKRQER